VLPGDTLSFEATITNCTSIIQTCKGWAKVKLPDGTWFHKYAVSPVSLNLEPSDTLTLTMTHLVPMATPAGEYEYWGYIGADVPLSWDSGMFTVTVVESN
jgi:hypothetical protein